MVTTGCCGAVPAGASHWLLRPVLPVEVWLTTDGDVESRLLRAPAVPAGLAMIVACEGLAGAGVDTGVACGNTVGPVGAGPAPGGPRAIVASPALAVPIAAAMSWSALSGFTGEPDGERGRGACAPMMVASLALASAGLAGGALGATGEGVRPSCVLSLLIVRLASDESHACTTTVRAPASSRHRTGGAGGIPTPKHLFLLPYTP